MSRSRKVKDEAIELLYRMYIQDESLDIVFEAIKNIYGASALAQIYQYVVDNYGFIDD